MAQKRIEKASDISEVSQATLYRLSKTRSPLVDIAQDMINFHCGALMQKELFCFSGKHPFTTNMELSKPIAIAGQMYTSIDEYMWTMKFKELANKPLPEKSNIIGYRGLLRNSFVTKERLEEWFLRRGFLHLQKAILRRAQTDPDFYGQLMRTGSKFIVYTYYKNKFMAAGATYDVVREWFNQCSLSNITMQIPNHYPLSISDLSILPVIKDGRNFLGAIYMALREQLKHKDPWHMKVNIPPLDNIPPPYPHQFTIPTPQKRRNHDSIQHGESKRRNSQELFPQFHGSAQSSPQLTESYIAPLNKTQRSPTMPFVINPGSVHNSTPVKRNPPNSNRLFRNHRQSFCSVGRSSNTSSNSKYGTFFPGPRSFASATTTIQRTPVVTPNRSFARLKLTSTHPTEANVNLTQEVSEEEQRLMEAADQVLPICDEDEHLNSPVKENEQLSEAIDKWTPVKFTSYETMKTPEHCAEQDRKSSDHGFEDDDSITQTEEDRLLAGNDGESQFDLNMNDEDLVDALLRSHR